MPKIQRSALVAFSAEQMFHLVNDVDAYSDFLPGCVASEVIMRGDSTMTAAVSIAKVGISNRFTTANKIKVGESIEMELVDGPFRALKGVWRFESLDERTCKVSLDLDFEFTNRLIAMAFGKVFHELVGSMIAAFSQRAKQVYRYV